MKKKRYDLILIIAILVIAAGISAFIYLGREKGAEVQVTIDGNVYATYDLGEDRTETITTDYGTNVLVIKDGIADVTDADCPDKLCVNETSIQNDGEVIVCLPHKLVVEIVGGESNDGIDAVVQ